MKFRPKDPGSAITHFIGWLMALLAAVPLILRACTAPDLVHVVSLSIFIVSMLLLYAASTLYHSLDINEKVNKRLKKFDHMMISVLIAGSYTPAYCRDLHTCMPHCYPRHFGIHPFSHRMGHRHFRHRPESLLGKLSEMGVFRTLHRNGMDLCPCIYSDFKQPVQRSFYVAPYRRNHLYDRRRHLCIEASNLQQSA